MDLWSLWLIIAIALIITEVLTLTMWSLCLAVGAFAAFLFSLFDLPYLWQGIAFVGGTALAYLAMLPWIKKRHHKSQKSDQRTGMDALIGRRSIVTQEIKPNSLGRVKIDGDNWQVNAPGYYETIPAGTEVTVTAYDGNILSVTVQNIYPSKI